MMSSSLRRFALASLVGLALLSGCSGGSALKQTPSLAGAGTSGTAVPVAITFTIPSSGTTTSSTTRKPEFVSSGINSAIASALQLVSGTWTPVAAQVYDLSPTSPNCGVPFTASTRKPETPAGRTCTIYLPAPTGNDQFELDTYIGKVGAGSNCTIMSTVASSCSLGSELSSGMDLGPGGNGYAVSLGSSTSVTISLQAIVASIVPGGLYNSSISTATGTSASGPSFGNPAFVVGAQTNNSTQEVNVCWSDNNGVAFPSEACTGAQNEDASGVTIQQSTSTCSNLQNDFATAFQLAPATVGGNVNDLTIGSATIQFESCANASAGNNVFVNVALGAGAPQSNPNYEVVDKPAADIFWNYTGGGGAGDESTTAPFWAAATSTTTGFPSGATVPVGITSPTQAATNPQVMTGATSAAKAVTYILAPLYAVVQDAAAIGGAQRESAGTNAVTLNLNGPDGFTAKLWAAQAAVPSNQSATGYQVIQPGSCAGVFTLGTRTTGKWGAMWPINGGGTAASGTTCQVLVYDNDQPTNHYVVVTITNTVAGGTLFGGGTTSVIFLTSGTTWMVPNDWNSANNTIEVIGGGGGGGGSINSNTGGGGGGGGGYSLVTNATLSPGSTVAIGVGSGSGGVSSGTAGAGGDTFLCNSASNCASIAGAAVIVGGKGGAGGIGSSGGGGAGSGGNAASGVGATTYSGGSGGASGNSAGGGGGGGGAAGKFGPGGTGGGASGLLSGGGGGGGNGGGTAGSLSRGGIGSNGGNNKSGSGGGSGGAPGSPGSNGGGGGGGDQVPGSGANGGAGGSGTEWDASHGSGGGGGGSGALSGGGGQGLGGGGGGYGGGGGGAGATPAQMVSGGRGSGGIIVITYTSAPGIQSLFRR